MLYLTYEELKRSVSISLKLTVSVTSECCILPMRNWNVSVPIHIDQYIFSSKMLYLTYEELKLILYK